MSTRGSTSKPAGYRACYFFFCCLLPEFRDDLDPNRTDTALNDLEEPATGEGFFYLVTSETASGQEGSLGVATGTERSNFTPCP